MRFALLILLAACELPVEPTPIEHVCDREKRAVWSALGHEDEPPASLMAHSEWNIEGSSRGLQGETFYFLVFAAEPSVCHVMRA